MPAVLALYEHEQDPERRALLLRVLAASRDPRAAIVLGEALFSSNYLEVREATRALQQYFTGFITGGSESQRLYLVEWFSENESSFRAAAHER